MALQSMPLNSATGVPVKRILNISHGVIGTTSIIDGSTYGKGVVLDTVELLRWIIPEGLPRLFWICSNSKVCCLNLEADLFALVLQVGYDLPV